MKNHTKISAALVLLLALTALCVSADTTYSSIDDPLVSLSYVNDVLGPQIAAKVLEMTEGRYLSADALPQADTGYQYLTLKAGQTLMAGSVCEMIILDGAGKAVVTSAANINAGQGLSDLTSGTVITDGQTVTPNHYIVIPKNDGRGVAFSSSSNILIRGEYNIAG